MFQPYTYPTSPSDIFGAGIGAATQAPHPAVMDDVEGQGQVV